MTLQQFVETWDGKFLERRDETNKNQCLDLKVAYQQDVLGIDMSRHLNASEIYTAVTADDLKLFDKIANTPTGVPQAGDIVVWKGVPGHVAVALDGCTTSKLRVFEQNSPIGSPCHIGEHDYKNVLGWLSPKDRSKIKQEENNMSQIDDLTNKNYTLGIEVNNLKNELKDANNASAHNIELIGRATANLDQLRQTNTELLLENEQLKAAASKTKPGIKTTELWAGVLAVISPILAHYGLPIDPTQLTIVAISYIAARTGLKIKK